MPYAGHLSNNIVKALLMPAFCEWKERVSLTNTSFSEQLACLNVERDKTNKLMTNCLTVLSAVNPYLKQKKLDIRNRVFLIRIQFCWAFHNHVLKILLQMYRCFTWNNTPFLLKDSSEWTEKKKYLLILHCIFNALGPLST